MNIIGKQFFVTGADGFIGSHLIELLVEQGANVRALVFYNSWNEIGWLKDISIDVLRQVEIVRGDIRDSDHMLELVNGCDYVMHLSSLIAIPYSLHVAATVPRYSRAWPVAPRLSRIVICSMVRLRRPKKNASC